MNPEGRHKADCSVVYQPIYNREALWISLPTHRRSAVKVSVGGINAITGLGKSTIQDPEDAIQDYLAPSQPWLDGIAKEPGVVRQFVAMRVDEGYTVEEQLTGKVKPSLRLNT